MNCFGIDIGRISLATKLRGECHDMNTDFISGGIPSLKLRTIWEVDRMTTLPHSTASETSEEGYPSIAGLIFYCIRDLLQV